MAANKMVDVIPDFAKKSHLNFAQYKQMYQASIDDSNRFWTQQA